MSQNDDNQSVYPAEIKPVDVIDSAVCPTNTSLPQDLVFERKCNNSSSNENIINERTPWTVFGYECSRSFLLFVFQCFLICTMVLTSIISLTTSKSCEETTVWVAILSSAVGYILPCPSLT